MVQCYECGTVYPETMRCCPNCGSEAKIQLAPNSEFEEPKKPYVQPYRPYGMPMNNRMNGYAVARQNGWMSANDIRALENLDRIPAEEGGDLYLINGNMTKLKDAGIFAGTAGKEKDGDEEVLDMEPDEGADGKAGADARAARRHRGGQLAR